MTPQPDSSLHSRREIEDRAIELGNDRREIHERLRENTQAIRDLVTRASGAGVGPSSLARLIGVSRQMLYQGNPKGQRK